MSDAGEPSGILVKLRGGTGMGFAAGAARGLGPVEHVLDVPAGVSSGMGLAGESEATWVRVPAQGNAWDHAHALMSGQYGAAPGAVAIAEPDVTQSWPQPQDDSSKQACVTDAQETKGGKPLGPSDGWHLGDAFSGLRTARGMVADADQAKVTIAHCDTGYDPDHKSRPVNMWLGHQQNFTKEGAPGSAIDMTPPGGGFTRNRGHGTATLSVLAGANPNQWPTIQGPLGGAPGVRILPLRVANSVLIFSTSTFVKAFDYAAKSGVDVLTMSMGGLASAALADAVNVLYHDKGIVVVTAAGNFVGLIPSPRSIVYPARMRRVIAATGVMADGRAYYGLEGNTMQGCHGPDAKMATAVAGWTPNIIRAELGCPGTLDENGEGTSFATPQVAATAALYIARHRDALARYSAPWMKAEAVRQALFRSARKRTAALDPQATLKLLGQGAIDAVAALNFAPLAEAQLSSAPEADAGWAWFKLLSGTGVGLAATMPDDRGRMLGLELLQLAQQDVELETLAADPETDAHDAASTRRFLEAVRDKGGASATLNRAIDRALGVASAKLPTLPPLAPTPLVTSGVAWRGRPRAPATRLLRIFTLDPSLADTLETAARKTASVPVRNETDANGDSILQPGPVGEYLEVVDVDPASDRFYPPVHLDDPRLLLEDGLEPSEGNPQFHQQMVYAVGMRTIDSFERALGRAALWARHIETDGTGLQTEYVQRLRIYPHALRDANAYYSPDRCALLFGYFPASPDRTADVAPGSMVFGCLSADIVAHEMTHALLDGYTLGYRDPTNPDVAAFHEAFADIVALFQHFQITDLVRDEIAKARGDLRAGTLLGGLARQFGLGIGQKGALRDYLALPDDVNYATSFEVHARGSLLVAAVYEAFLAIFTYRTGDLIRLASGGSGILANGAIHPDLVERLAQEACKAAGHVLGMCIRALDYAPAIDIRFGDYLRAIVTADLGQVADDSQGYRTAFLQSFRRRNLLPAKLRTVSIETLRWDAPRPEDTAPDWLPGLLEVLKIDWGRRWGRAKIAELARARAAALHEYLVAQMGVQGRKAGMCHLLGLQPDLPAFDKNGVARGRSKRTQFEVRSVRAARRHRPDDSIAEKIVIVLAQRRPEWIDETNKADGFFWYRGASTIVIDPGLADARPFIDLVITRRLEDGDRLAAERDYRRSPPTDSARALYFGGAGLAAAEPFAALHAEDA